MGDDMDGDNLGPGLHVFREAAPLERAGTLAARLRADLCVTLQQAEATVAERRALPTVEADGLEALRVLAGRIVTADRIAERTRDRATAEIAERLAGPGAGIAVHPSMIRERAAAVVQARTDLAQAQQLVDAHATMEHGPFADLPTAESLVPAPRPEPVPLGPVHRKRGWFSFLRRDRSEVQDTTESSNLLRAMSAATDEAFGARRALVVRDDQRTLLQVRRDAALEVVRVTERSWQDLAGPEVDPAEVEEVVRRLDPQHQDAVLLARETVSVRAASTLFDNAMGRWQASWDDLHLEPPSAAEAVEAVDRLVGRITRAVVLVGDATERGLDVAEVAPAAPVVVIEGLLEDG